MVLLGGSQGDTRGSQVDSIGSLGIRRVPKGFEGFPRDLSGPRGFEFLLDFYMSLA